MADTPLVSIVIPCFNAERFLAQTVESAFAQSHPATEIILVDDGSTDGTRELIATWGARVRAIHGPNRGAAAARNTGTAAARGEYIQYLDADDLLAVDAVRSRVDALLASGAGVAYSDWQALDETADGSFQPGRIRSDALPAQDVDVALFRGFWCPPAALLYHRRAAAATGGWKQHLAPIEDARFMLDAALAGERYVHVPGVGALYRVFDGPSHSRRDPGRFVAAVLANAREMEALWSRSAGGLDHAGRRQALLECYGYVARASFRAHPALHAQAFDCIEKLRPGFRPDWPHVAGLLQRWLGHAAALRILALMRRPAP